MLYREGDIVTLRARVAFNQEPGDVQLHLDVEGDTSKLIVDAKAVMLLQRAFRVGDKVRMGEWHGTVLATSGTGTGMLLWAEGVGGHKTLDAINCKLIDEPAPPSMPAGGIGSWVKDEKAEFLAGGE